MKTHLILNIFILLFLVLSVKTTNRAQTIESVLDKQYGIIYTDCGVSYKLRVLSITHGVGHLFMLTDGKYFNEKDLSTLFRCLSKKYPEFPQLSITLFSDPVNLKIAIDNHFRPPPDVNPPIDTSETDCKNLSKAVVPCPYGYYRATYFRFRGDENFEFSEDPNKTAMRTVDLKKQKK